MKKNYVKPEVDYIALLAKEPITTEDEEIGGGTGVYSNDEL